MGRKAWVYDPHSGGIKIPKAVQERTRSRIISYAEKNFSGKFDRIDVRFRGALCYIDAYTEPYVSEEFDPNEFGESREEYLKRLRSFPTHLCRLRYFGDEDSWTMAFFTYSNEKYQPSVFNNGSFHGTPEEAFETSSSSLYSVNPSNKYGSRGQEKSSLPLREVVVGPQENIDFVLKGVREFLDENGFKSVVARKSNIPFRPSR